MYFSGTSTTLQSSASLKTVTPNITPINNPTYTTYAYGLWLNINSWDSTVSKTIFSRAGNIKLYLDQNTPTLYCDLIMSGGTPAVQTMVITDNFPIQKWTHIIVSLDNQFMDVYLDGKLVKSQRFYTPPQSGNPGIMPATPPDNPVPVTLGNTGAGTFGAFDAYVAKFTRWTTPMDPQTAWNTYMSGNGGNTLANMFSSYNVNMNILKNNVQTASYSLY